MRNWIVLGAAIAVAVLTPACAPPEEAHETVEEVAEQQAMSPKEAMVDLVERWDAGMNSDDTEALLALYVDDDAAAMAPDRPAVVGREALRGFFEELFAMGQITVENEVETVVADGDHLVGKGTYQLAIIGADGETVDESGNWLCIAVRQADDTYKVMHNIWNRDTPPPGAPQPPPIADAGPEADPNAACHGSPKALDEAFEADLEAGNVAALVAAHTKNGSRLPPNMPEMAGRAQVSAYLLSRMDPFSERVLDLTDITEMIDGSLGITVGRYSFEYTPAAGGEHATGQGKYIAASRQGEDGCWRLHWVIWNRDAPVSGEES
jgi:ketosteroid isomerase-like protein